MITYYCPNCWTIIGENDQICPHCNYDLKQFQELAYEEKLLAALHHPVSEHRVVAAQILGERGSKRALPEFQKILDSGETNYFLLRAILLSTAKIEDPSRDVILRQALHHPSGLISCLARVLLDGLSHPVL